MAWWIVVGIFISGLVVVATRVSFLVGLDMLFLERVLIGWAFGISGVGLDGAGISGVGLGGAGIGTGDVWEGCGSAISGSLVCVCGCIVSVADDVSVETCPKPISLLIPTVAGGVGDAGGTVE